jgi:uncharacterized protein YbjT (DUF2867 family)
VKVAVLGATGFIGRTLLPKLAGEHDVVAVSRSGAEVEDDRVKSVSGDVTDHATMRRALDGVDVVYYLVHSLGASDFSERDKRAAATVATEASAPASPRSSTSAALGTIERTSLRTCAAVPRRPRRSKRAPSP